MKIRDFLIGVGAQVDRSSFNQAENATKNLKNGLYAITGALGALAGAGYIVKRFVDDVAKVGDETNKTARNLGANAEAFQEWRYVAGLAGVQAGDFNNAIKFLQRGIAEAGEGTGTALKGFERLGISVKKSDGTLKSYDDVLKEVAENLPKLNEAERVATSMDLFSRSGLKMIDVLMQGNTEIAKLRQRAQDLGIVMSVDMMNAMEEYNDRMDDIGLVTFGLKTQIANVLIPSMTKLAVTIINNLAPAIKWLKENSEQLKSTLQFVGKAFMWVAGATALWGLGALTTGIIGLTAKLTLLGWAGIGAFAKMLVLPLLVGAGILVLTVLVVELWNALTTDKKTIFGYLLDDLKNINEYWKSEFDPMIDKLRDILGTRRFADYMEAMQKAPTVQELQNRAKSSMATIAEIPTVNYATVGGFDKFASPMPSNTKTISIGNINITEPVDVDKMKSFFVDDFRAFTNSMEGN
ncbi:MAG: hypothetical protein RBS96_05660 [Dehalococcoidales bacterium]|jgi:hypothetical protein|nr:hypothetical protein [Dehalococcoidales bacterium]